MHHGDGYQSSDPIGVVQRYVKGDQCAPVVSDEVDLGDAERVHERHDVAHTRAHRVAAWGRVTPAEASEVDCQHVSRLCEWPHHMPPHVPVLRESVQ